MWRLVFLFCDPGKSLEKFADFFGETLDRRANVDKMNEELKKPVSLEYILFHNGLVDYLASSLFRPRRLRK